MSDEEPVLHITTDLEQVETNLPDWWHDFYWRLMYSPGIDPVALEYVDSLLEELAWYDEVPDDVKRKLNEAMVLLGNHRRERENAEEGETE